MGSENPSTTEEATTVTTETPSGKTTTTESPAGTTTTESEVPATTTDESTATSSETDTSIIDVDNIPTTKPGKKSWNEVLANTGNTSNPVIPIFGGVIIISALGALLISSRKKRR